MIVFEGVGFERIDAIMQRDMTSIAEAPLVGALDASLRKTIKRIGKKVQKTTKKVGAKAQKGFVKAAPVLAVAAQGLNFLIPGLGVAVGLAVSTGAAALKARQDKKAFEKEEKAEAKVAAAQAAAQEAELTKQTDAQAIDAFTKGEAYFTQTYGITKEQFLALPTSEKLKFMQGTVYDQVAPDLMAAGITREKFLSMPVDEQNRILAALVVPEGEMPEWLLPAAVIGGGVLLVGLALFVMLKLR